jgi:integrase
LILGAFTCSFIKLPYYIIDLYFRLQYTEYFLFIFLLFTTFCKYIKRKITEEDTPKRTRKTFATTAARSGLSDAEIQYILGHAGSILRQHYVLASHQDILGWLEKLDFIGILHD